MTTDFGLPNPETVRRRERHALYTGWVAGIAMRHGLVVDFVTDDEGNYTDQLEVMLDELTITLVVPYPPDDWTLT